MLWPPLLRTQKVLEADTEKFPYDKVSSLVGRSYHRKDELEIEIGGSSATEKCLTPLYCKPDDLENGIRLSCHGAGELH